MPQETLNTAPPPLSADEFAQRFAEIHPPFEPQEAVIEADRCLFCWNAPCTAACPTHIDVPRFIKKIATGNLRGASMTILDANILGLSCSRVCPVDVLCEGSCVLERYNKKPIEIGRLQRHAMDYFYAHGARLPSGNEWGRSPTCHPGNGTPRVACIGAGPASLACAAELRRHGIPVTVFDSRPLAGGLNTYGVAEYKFRPQDSLREVELVRSLGVEFRLGEEIGSTVPLEKLEQAFAAIFIGVGLGPTEALAIPGEGLRGVVDALTFIASYKTGQAKVGQRVVVVGGGNTAIDAATAAKRLGAEQVTILYRRGKKEMPAFQYEFELAMRDGIEFQWFAQPVAMHGGDEVESVECLRMELGLPDGTGRRMPQPVEGSNFMVPCDMAITSIGQSRLIDFLARCRAITLADGCVVVDAETGRTANPRYFAGGDCVNGGREVVDAVAEGKRAGRGIAQRLGGK